MALAAYAKLALNFYYLLLGDEALAITAAANTLRPFKKTKNKNATQAQFIHQLVKDYEKLKKKIQNKKIIGTHQLTKSQWRQPPAQKMVKWREFLKASDQQSEVVLTLRYLLSVPVPVIAEALDVPKGTVLYRMGKGLEVLSKR